MPFSHNGVGPLGLGLQSESHLRGLPAEGGRNLPSTEWAEDLLSAYLLHVSAPSCWQSLESYLRHMEFAIVRSSQQIF